MDENRASNLLSSLTRRQTQVLDLALERLENKVIAARLGISERTVETHIEKAARKLGTARKNPTVKEYERLLEAFGNAERGFSRLGNKSGDRAERGQVATDQSIPDVPVSRLDVLDAQLGGKWWRLAGIVFILVMVLTAARTGLDFARYHSSYVSQTSQPESRSAQ
ncbi:helix-turn-helix domain-containing protein [Erythrobacter crassostreae]|uniref:Helix-turn-helix transcriptional regulator n=1 Tax=Erythrobacter crassostreae TaxID=2828328 RepID=A0A9X1F1P5_9SPHN|nr:helix-turn-helix transcriptional regulator [Erythrobacter crassostrea]MBV7258676.1 helix-turn-helix transcriptional regulator [Erythrobacter crassostrea]